jgi:hypothetical protein
MAGEDIGTEADVSSAIMKPLLHVLNVGALLAYAVWVGTVAEGETMQWLRLVQASILYLAGLTDHWAVRRGPWRMSARWLGADRERFQALSQEDQEWVIRGSQPLKYLFSLPYIASFWWLSRMDLASDRGESVAWLPVVIIVAVLMVLGTVLLLRQRRRFQERRAEIEMRRRRDVLDSFS